MQGQTNFHAGVAAEAQVARHFAGCGYDLCAERWRGPGGEIDLIFSDMGGERMIAVEVKKAPSHAEAAARVTGRQLARIGRSAAAYAGRMPKGSLTDIRIDIALVDDVGRIHVIENAML